MLAAGIDIGSRTVKAVVLEDSNVIFSRVVANTFDPIGACREVLDGASYDVITATGYGRHLFAQYFPCSVVTEIRAVTMGARQLLPGARTILDIGGQDTKVVAIDGRGLAGKFEMNDRCAAGTGRFLEVMAAALNLCMADFIESARNATHAQKINSMCTVFAESEVVSMVARGIPRDHVALGIHQAIAGRAAAMLHRIVLEPDIVFCGGVALNQCIRECVESALGRPVLAAPEPQSVAALGCALLAKNSKA